jgi:predicted nucleotidyltransferase
MTDAARLFETVPERDSLGFWPGGALDARKVVDFLRLSKQEVAKIAGVATPSVRFDQKIPFEVQERLEEIANVIALVAQFFASDVRKTALWFRTRNPMLGQMSPVEMIRLGRFDRLRRFVMDALADQMPRNIGADVPGNPSAEPSVQASAAGVDHPLIVAHRTEIERLCERYGVRRLSLFGSILRPEFNADTSDVDLVVQFGASLPAGMSAARQYFDFKAALERVLGRPVDLVELDAMPETRLKRIIQRTQVPLYGEAA